MTDQLRQRPGDQPLPVPNDRPSIQGLVRADLALRDAYDEALDLACYLRQAIEERDHPVYVQPEPWKPLPCLMKGCSLEHGHEDECKP